MSSKKPGKPSLSVTEADRALKALERLYTGKFNRNKSELARALGISQPAVTQLLAGTNNASLETARAVAKLEGVPVSAYLDGTAEPDEDTGPFPSKGRAAKAARLCDFADWAIEQMLTEPPPHGIVSDPGVVFWFRRVEQLLSAVPQVPRAGAPRTSTVVPSDEPGPRRRRRPAAKP